MSRRPEKPGEGTESHMKKLAFENYRAKAAQSREGSTHDVGKNIRFSDGIIFIDPADTGYARLSDAQPPKRGSISKPKLSASGAEALHIQQSLTIDDQDFVTPKHYGPIEASIGKATTLRKEVITRNLEAWWITSPLWIRLIPQIFIFLIVIAIANLVAGLIILYQGLFDEHKIDVYACRTEKCLKIGDWINSALDEKSNPCEDFYGFVCNNYKDPTLLKRNELDMLFVRLQYERQETLANVLRKSTSKDKVVTFYKACMDERSRFKEGIKPMINLIYKSGLLEKKQSVEQKAGTLTWVIGDFGFFNYVYFRGKSLQAWVLSDFHKGLAQPEVQPLLEGIFLALNENDQDSKFIHNLVQEFDTAIFPNSTEQKSTEFYVKVISELLGVFGICLVELSKKCTDKDCKDKIDSYTPHIEEYKKIFDFKKTLQTVESLSTLVEGENLFFGNDELDKPLLDPEEGGLYFLPGCIQQKYDAKYGSGKINDDTIRLGYITFFIMRIFDSYAKELDSKTYYSLIPEDTNASLFETDAHFKQVPLEYQCLDSLAANYGLYFLSSLSKEIGAEKVLQGKYKDLQRKFVQILRKWVAIGKFAYLTKEEELSFKNFVAPTTYLDLQDKHYNERKLQYLNHWVPSKSDHFSNCWQARNHSEYEYNNDWQNEDLTLWMSKVGREVLQEIRTEHGSIRKEGYANSHVIFVPIPMVISPYVNNDMSLMNWAGGASFIARAVVNLLRENQLLYNFGCAFSYRTTLERVSKKCQACRSFKCKQCLDSNPNLRCLYHQYINVHSSALAIKLTYELIENYDEFHTRVLATNRKIILEPSYNSKGNVSGYFRYQFAEDGSGNLTDSPKEYSAREASIRTYYPPRLHYKYIQGLERFNEHQLFFITFIRHHCYNKNLLYKENVNSILRQVDAFSQVWGCTKDDPMNGEGNKCYNYN